jgi:hypothetical protein
VGGILFGLLSALDRHFLEVRIFFEVFLTDDLFNLGDSIIWFVV